MKTKTISFISILAAAVFILGACGGSGGDSSNTQTAAPPKQAEPKTDIRAIGNGAEMTISPTTNNMVKGRITLSMTKFPSSTQSVSFAMEKQGSGAINLGQDSDGSDGYAYVVDTSAYENGVYEIGGVAFASSSSREPIGIARAQIIIEN